MELHVRGDRNRYSKPAATILERAEVKNQESATATATLGQSVPIGSSRVRVRNPLK